MMAVSWSDFDLDDRRRFLVGQLTRRVVDYLVIDLLLLLLLVTMMLMMTLIVE